MAISRMQQPRQMYGLGSIVKKAVRGVKKIAKSPLGKAAIIGGLGMYGTGTGLFGSSGMFSGAKGAGFLRGLGNLGAVSNLRGPAELGNTTGGGFFSKALRGGKNFFGGMTTGQKIFTGLAGTALAAPFLAGGPEEVVEEAEDQIDVDAIKQSARDFYMGTGGKNLSFMPKKEYVDQNFYAQQSAADGGRIGYAMGGNTDDEDEVVRMTAGQRIMPRATFLNMGGGAGPMLKQNKCLWQNL